MTPIMLMTRQVLEEIAARLRKNTITIDRASIKKNRIQGEGSEAYVVPSNAGKLIIHIGELGADERARKPWLKTFLASRLLRRFPAIPTARVLSSGVIGTQYFTVQNLLPGTSPGVHSERDVVKNTWHIWSPELERDIEETIARIHQIPLSGGGWIAKRDNGIGGTYKSWEEFLAKETKAWFAALNHRGVDLLLREKLIRHYQKNKRCFKSKQSFLVHGDLINPSNWLVRLGKVTGVVDWEFALAGDPAWEFCSGSRYHLTSYFAALHEKSTARQRRDFFKRSHIYEPLSLSYVLFLVGKGDSAYLPFQKRLKRYFKV